MVTNQGLLEISELSSRAETLARGTPADRAQSAVLLARIKSVREQECSSDEMRARYTGALVEEVGSGEVTETRYMKAFHRYLYHGDQIYTQSQEHRDLLAGTQTFGYTQGAAGGYIVPQTYSDDLKIALSQVDPLLSSNICHFVMEDTPFLRPQQISGYDLSTISATQILETAQQTTSNFPPVLGRILRANITYRISIAASIEAEDDVPSVMQKFIIAYGVGFARKLGQDCISGNGTTAPQGLLTALTPSYTTTTTGKIGLADLNSIYFLVNRVYRASARCAWLMSDGVYERCRAAVDLQGRPLINIVDDRETLFGKPIYISPTLVNPGGSLALQSTIIFGDFSAFHIRVSKPTLQRVINSSIADITSGRSLYVARIKMDSALFDPSSGSAPPIVSATVVA